MYKYNLYDFIMSKHEQMIVILDMSTINKY
jgi:hypothetical protein